MYDMRKQASLVALSLSLALGCNGGGGISSGLPQDRPVDQLTSEQIHQFCESVDDYLFRLYPVSEEHRVSCTASALGSTLTEAACQERVSACLMEEFAGRDHLDCSSGSAGGCTATVDQLETCIEQRAASIEARAADVQCSAAGDLEEIGRLVSAIPLPASCSSLSTACRARIGI